MNKLITIQDKHQSFLDSVLGRLVEKCESNEEDLDDGNMRSLAHAILSCDTRNFPLLWKIEPRLFKLVLEDHVNVAMIERLEGLDNE